jgi:hypothetical protein
MQLRNIWTSQAASGAVRLDVLPWLNKTTLDIIGLAGLFKFIILSVMGLTGF